MFLSLDNLAHRYNCLPSQALNTASTIDLYVLDLSAKWHVYQQDISEGRTVKHDLTQEQMQSMIHNVRNNNDKNDNN
jgi:hypothetical protein